MTLTSVLLWLFVPLVIAAVLIVYFDLHFKNTFTLAIIVWSGLMTLGSIYQNKSNLHEGAWLIPAGSGIGLVVATNGAGPLFGSIYAALQRIYNSIVNPRTIFNNFNGQSHRN